MTEPVRCAWVPLSDSLYVEYHDTEWGVPIHNDRLLFEFLILEGAQAGLSWKTILRRRENYRAAFDNFEPRTVASYNMEKISELLANSGIIRNALKINSAVINANAFLKVEEEHGSFDNYIWKFVGGSPLMNRWEHISEVPTRSSESDAMSKDLLKRGFKFAGSTICYAFMQATGMVNDHTIDCFRYKDLHAKNSV